MHRERVKNLSSDSHVIMNSKSRDDDVIDKQQSRDCNVLDNSQSRIDKVKNESQLCNRTDKDKNEDVEYNISASRIIDSLNRLGNKNFRINKANKKFIIARLKENYTEEDCLKVLETKIKDQYFKENLKHYNPHTLFRPTNFEKYLNAENNFIDVAQDITSCELPIINVDWLKQNEYTE